VLDRKAFFFIFLTFCASCPGVKLFCRGFCLCKREDIPLVILLQATRYKQHSYLRPYDGLENNLKGVVEPSPITSPASPYSFPAPQAGVCFLGSSLGYSEAPSPLRRQRRSTPSSRIPRILHTTPSGTFPYQPSAAATTGAASPYFGRI
jgi:hypothetical protein